MNVNHLILDYYAMVEKFGPLDFETFTEMWTDADAIARAARDDDEASDGDRPDGTARIEE